MTLHECVCVWREGAQVLRIRWDWSRSRVYPALTPGLSRGVVSLAVWKFNKHLDLKTKTKP